MKAWRIFCISFLIAFTRANAQQAAERAIVFARGRGAVVPEGWERFAGRFLRTFGHDTRIIRTGSKAPEFQFHLQAEQFAYVIKTAHSGPYLVRLGFAESRRCEKQKRVLSFRVNRVEVPAFDIASEVGCKAPFYRDVFVNVRKRKRVVIFAKRLSVFDPPILSNVAIFTTVASQPPPSLLTSVSGTPASRPSELSSSYTSSTPSSPAKGGISESSTVTPSQSANPIRTTTSPSCSTIPSVSVSSTLAQRLDPSASATTVPLPSFSAVSELSEVEVDIGVNDWPLSETNAVEVITPTGDIDVANVEPTVPANVFHTAVQGQFFNLSFPLTVGTYDATLGFVEYDLGKCTGSGRTFSVSVNGVSRLESVDVFNLANGCRRAVTVILSSLIVEEYDKQPLVFAFQGISAPAILSYVSIQRANVQCMPVSGDINLRDDHLAHAVPGKYPPTDDSSYVDHEGIGFVRVFIDGRRSHTHFFSDGRAGHIRRYTWTDLETTQVLSRASNFWYNFPRGTTRVRLSIVDEACSMDTADFSVTVTGNKQTGAYCYYYKDLETVPVAGMLGSEKQWPVHAYVQKSLTFGFPNFWFSRTRFSARCIFSLNVEASEETSISLITRGSGRAQLYKSGGLVRDSEASDGKASNVPMTIGVHEFELFYFREDLSQTSFLQVMFDNAVPQGIFFDQSSVVPLLAKTSPDGGRVTGNENVTLIGFGLHLPLTVFFGDASAEVLEEGASSTRVQVIAPHVEDERSVLVSVVSATGSRSNSVVYTYGVDCDEVSFESHELVTESDENVDVGAATCVTTWLDGSLFIGTYDGYVRVVHYDIDTLRVSSVCHSERVTDSRYEDSSGKASLRTILGITFDPRNVTSPQPYISTSTLFWDRRNSIANIPSDEKWANGAVERLKAASHELLETDGSICLSFDRRIVSNLPVSDGDHSVNALLFTQDGDLLVAVGGFTNAGLPYMSAGGTWESYLSGAIIRARLSLGSSFDGELVHDPPDNLRTAVLVKGDVDLYATGFRNLFSLTMTRDGEIYGVDMGANCNMGNASSACDEYDETAAAKRDTSSRVPFPGRVDASVDDGCRGGVAREDKLVRVMAGGYYGHANLQRSRISNVSECAWIDPETNMVPAPVLAQPPSHYVAPVSMVKSATTAVVPYGARAFCGRLRNSLLLGLYKGFGVFRSKASGSGEGGGGVERIADGGGIAGVENVVGDVVFVSNVNGRVSVLRPRVSLGSNMMAVNALPFRHPAHGASRLTVGGRGFANNVSVLVGDGACDVTAVSYYTVVCIVPPFAGVPGQESVDVRVSAVQDGTQQILTSVLTKAVLYMKA